MRLLTGDECGLIKETIPEVGRPERRDTGPTNATSQQVTVDMGIRRIDNFRQTRERGVLAMTWMDKCGRFAALRANSSVEVWEGSYGKNAKMHGKYELVQAIDNVFDSKSMSRPLFSLGYSQEMLCAGDSLGNIAIINPEKGSVVASYSAFTSNKQKSTITYTKGKVINTQQASALATSPCGRIAISGRERETTVLDVNTGSQVWKAKNLAPDAQTLLQQPVWSTALTFLSSDLILSGTAYKQVRLYDIRSNSRRPVSYTAEGLLEHRVTSLCAIDEKSYVVGDAAGCLSLLDSRVAMAKSKKSSITTIPRFVGPVGSIRQIVHHPSHPLIACVGLDRMLRTYNVITRKQIDCIYLKQRLNAVLFCDDREWQCKNDHGSSDDDGADQGIDAEDDVQDYVVSDEEGDSDRDSDDFDYSDESNEDNNSTDEKIKDKGDGCSDDDDDDDDDNGSEDEDGDDGDEKEKSEDNISSDDDSDDFENVIEDDDPFSQSRKKQRR